ncbi:iron ABC transporter permease [Verminephrobacter aporrectodeae subsp. tuberculatae]|uniref:ABC transporter permease n=1 Tax=Verminephrobacter aporrectodeae TaxID=1110389 RepID=UPI00023756C9|nr:iron ABC transporter permease [Verminephrobacter aporrectodeae]MCW8164379.1 iron ABC transporter permease [Verminephrobacter aporrectodeae subsp. tuberculatae]MCW8170328.1 iron ABC transporter permease [Verminephrobacter aporrectodeae subsp. tuberculatae]
MRRTPFALRNVPLILCAGFLALPVLALLASWLPVGPGSAQAGAILREMAATVLPGYLWTTLWLGLLVALGTALVGSATAVAVSMFDFPGRRSFEWLLLLPLAMPAYVTAYAYTDFLQFSGPLQTGLRDALGLQGRLLPEVRSLGGAVWVFVSTLYPYVYLLARTALGAHAAQPMEAARLLGAALPRRIRTVALPLARPAVAAGVALVLMETLADFGVASYFGMQTISTGIYKAWLSMDNRLAAAQLATLLLAVVLALLHVERRAQERMRFASGSHRAAQAQPLALHGAQRWAAWVVCALPVVMGFVAPVACMLRPLAADWSVLPWERFLHWAWNSLRLSGITALLAVAIALALALALRRRPDAVTRGVLQLAGMGYAVPGTVIVVGLLLPVGWLQAALPQWGLGALVTTTALGIVWAYLVRFSAVALQSIQSGYARIPLSLDDSARLLGSSGCGLLARVHWPLLKRSSAAAALLVFVDAMKELPATMVLRPFDSDTLAVVAYQLARDERLGEAALPSLALVAVGLAPVLLLSRALRSR